MTSFSVRVDFAIGLDQNIFTSVNGVFSALEVWTKLVEFKRWSTSLL
jgi:hypothetical protein